MATSQDIINGALINIGEEPLTSPNEKNKAGRLARNRYDIIRQEVLYRHPWKCASARERLSPQVAKPVFDRQYKFSIPPDVLRIWRVVDTSSTKRIEDVTCVDESWKKEGRELLSNYPDIGIEYVRDEKNISLLDPLLVDAISLRLAVDICYSLTQDTQLRTQLQALFTELLVKAKSVDAKQEAPRRLEANEWIYRSRTTFPVPAIPGLQ